MSGAQNISFGFCKSEKGTNLQWWISCSPSGLQKAQVQRLQLQPSCLKEGHHFYWKMYKVNQKIESCVLLLNWTLFLKKALCLCNTPSVFMSSLCPLILSLMSALPFIICLVSALTLQHPHSFSDFTLHLPSLSASLFLSVFRALTPQLNFSTSLHPSLPLSHLPSCWDAVAMAT